MKYTDEFWLKELKEEGYKFIGRENGQRRNKIISMCPNGNEFKFDPSNFINKGYRCQCEKCYTKIRWTEEKIIELCKSADITFIKRNKTKILIKCNKSNIKYERYLSDLCRTTKCNCEECGGRIIWTEDKIKEKIEPYGYKFISFNYDNNGFKNRNFNTLCPSENPYKMNIQAFLKRNRRCGCEDCTGRISWTDEKIRNKVESKGYEYLGFEIRDRYEKYISMRCEKGNITTSSIPNLIPRDWNCCCDDCTGRTTYTKERIVEELERVNYTYINHYRNNTNHLRVECECANGHYYNCNFWNFVNYNIRCDQCNLKSRGETQIHDDFNTYNIQFIHEHTFPDCKHIGLLKFDFAVYDKSGNLGFVCEYDGEQHYKPSRFGSQTQEEAEIAFKQLQIRDKIKDEYCKNNNIPFIRVSYKVKYDNIFNYIKTKLLVNYGIKIHSFFNVKN